jgi:hypothetical protein
MCLAHEIRISFPKFSAQCAAHLALFFARHRAHSTARATRQNEVKELSNPAAYPDRERPLAAVYPARRTGIFACRNFRTFAWRETARTANAVRAAPAFRFASRSMRNSGAVISAAASIRSARVFRACSRQPVSFLHWRRSRCGSDTRRFNLRDAGYRSHAWIIACCTAVPQTSRKCNICGAFQGFPVHLAFSAGGGTYAPGTELSVIRT